MIDLIEVRELRSELERIDSLLDSVANKAAKLPNDMDLGDLAKLAERISGAFENANQHFAEFPTEGALADYAKACEQ